MRKIRKKIFLIFPIFLFLFGPDIVEDRSSTIHSAGTKHVARRDIELGGVGFAPSQEMGALARSALRFRR
jgi:hypothetical protein